jgi:histone H3/H4
MVKKVEKKLDNLISSIGIKRLAKNAGISKVSNESIGAMKKQLQVCVDGICKDVDILLQSSRGKTINKRIINSLKKMN